MSEFKISRLRFTWVGEWVDQTFYNTDEIVQYEGKAYVCLMPHTSNGFYADLGNIEPKWVLMMTGQTWKGTWQPFNFYSLDNIVIFGGIVYKCNTQHLSGVVLDTDLDKWDVYAESKTWQSQWTSRTTYGIGAIVQYGASVYECTVSHVSADTDLEGLEVDYNPDDSTLSKWTLLKEGVSWKGEYVVSTQDSSVFRYILGDIVKYGPTLYKCLVGHAPKVSTDDYSSLMPLTDTFEPSFWEEWMPGLDFDGIWNADTLYQPGDIVLYGGYLYVNKVINNVNIKPSFNSQDSTDAWEIVTKAFDVEGAWSSDVEYKIGSVVTYGGDVYLALTDSTNEIPGNTEVSVTYNSTGSSGTTLKLSNTSNIRIGMTVIGEGFAEGQNVVRVVDENTVIINKAPNGNITNGVTLIFAGANAPYWELLIPGFNWEGKWAEGRLYNQDDVAYFGNATYKCIREHTSSLVSRPDNDLLNNFWVVYLQHFQGNTLTNSGEMIVYNNQGIAPLALGVDTNVLKVTQGLPVWSEIFFTPAVYYVADNGIDSVNRGTTWDIPWRTIRYACERVKEGIFNPEAKVLLRENKSFIVEETFFWMKLQQEQNVTLFDEVGEVDDEKTRRDIEYIVDAVIYDLTRGGNSQIVASTLAYFNLESTNRFTNDTVAEQVPVYIAVLVKLFEQIDFVLRNSIPPESYQPSPAVDQYFNSALVVPQETLTTVGALENILLSALIAGSPNGVPPANEGLPVTINIKSGTYEEMLPIVVPANAAINGDELRGVTVKPKDPVNTLCTRTTAGINQFTVGSTLNIGHNTPVQFVSLNPVVETSTIIGGPNVVAGQTYYVIGDSITDTTFQVSVELDGAPITLLTNIGFMYVYGGTALSDMFYVQNGTGIRNITCTGLLGTLTDLNEYGTRRPTGGAYVSLDPGEGPDDTSAWIIRKSPYIQNVTNFGLGCIGLKIDSTLHNGGNRSIVCNDYTQIISDGIGIWCTGGDALCEAVSVFSYYNYTGYFSEDGGRVRATNGNSSYGTFGCVAEGFDPSEIPATGIVNNKSTQASAAALSALGSNAEILRLQYTHAGEEYFGQTTNLLKQSNNVLDTSVWNTDGNIVVTRASTSPFSNGLAWRTAASTGLTDSAYLYQSVDVSPQGKTYTNISGENITGSGVDATFDVTVFSDRYVVSVNAGGSGYVVGNQIRLLGTNFGGQDGTNDIFVNVETLSITTILTIVFNGTVPAGSNLPYTLSLHCKKGTAQYIDLYALYTGFDTRTSNIRFNFDTLSVSASDVGNDGIVPSELNRGFEVLENDWYRIWFTVYDETAQNTQLEYRIYPRGIDGLAGFTNIAGAQLSINSGLSFYLGTENDQPTAFADIDIQGAGSGVRAIADELRSGSVFETRILENSAFVVGGVGYKTQTNNAQTGTDEFLTLAQSEVAEASEYEGMRISIGSGRGAGQYGIISTYDTLTKRAFVLKESFDQLEIVSADALTDRFELDTESDINTIFPGQKVQFTPTFFDVVITETSQNSVDVLATEGDLNNIMTVSSTARLRENMAINFSGTVFGGVITNFTYFILTIIDDTRIQLSTSLGGGIWPFNTENLEDGEIVDLDRKFSLNYPANTSYLTANSTADMEVVLPIQFTGTSLGGVELGITYFIHDVYNSTQFSISATKVEVPISATSDVNNLITTDDTSGLIPMNPIIFKGETFGNLLENSRYYINDIVDGTSFTIADAVLTGSVTATQAVTNLITIDSTAGFTPNRPIVFTGTVFGNIVNDRVYYIQVINSATTFTISDAPGGAAVTLTTATGEIIARTTANTVTQSTASGTMTAIAPGTKETVTAGSGIMEASFFTETFGGISTGTTYYVLETFTENSAKEFTITATQGGTTPVSLETATGSMQLGAVGWDHINPGTPLVNLFDSTSVYNINPRLTFSAPPFVEAAGEQIALGGEYFKIVSSGFTAIAIPRLGNQLLNSTDLSTWNTDILLPVTATIEGNGGWVDSTYGKTAWIIISASGESLVSVSDGASWITRSMPTLDAGTYSAIAYGNGRFVAIADGTNESAYSTNLGSTWTAATDSVIETDEWIDIAYGNGVFVAISRGSNVAKYSLDGGETWEQTLLDNSEDSTTNNWTQIEFGNGRFVAVSSDLRSSAYSLDGITWYNSNLNVQGSLLKYGQGVFVLINPESSVCYVSEDGFNWKQQEVAPSPYTALGFNFDNITRVGSFGTISSNQVTSQIKTGARTKASARVDSGSILSVSTWEPGSGYINPPTIKITDPNNSTEAILQPRIGNGTLGAPSFVSQGAGYNTSSTSIVITGDGFADKFQPGLRLVTDSVTRLPAPGDNLEFEGNSIIYRVANSRILKGTTTPNLEVEIQLSPQLTQDTAPAHDTPFTIRSRFSQVRLTNHDFLNIGFGNELQSNYPGLPERTGLEPQDEIVETNNGRIFYSSTDQDGNFRVGDLFAVEQATGIVTLNASEFGLDGLSELEIGGVALGGSPVTITQFSTDGTFVANSNNIVPTQRAIRTYLASRLSQGGSDTFTGLLTAGTVKIGGPDEIDSTVTRGAEGWRVRIPVKANFAGPNQGWDGDGLAMAYFMKTIFDPTRQSS